MNTIARSEALFEGPRNGTNTERLGRWIWMPMLSAPVGMLLGLIAGLPFADDDMVDGAWLTAVGAGGIALDFMTVLTIESDLSDAEVALGGQSQLLSGMGPSLSLAF